MQRWRGSSRGTTFCQVTDDDAMPWIITTTGPEPESPATWRIGALRNHLRPMVSGYRLDGVIESLGADDRIVMNVGCSLDVAVLR